MWIKIKHYLIRTRWDKCEYICINIIKRMKKVFSIIWNCLRLYKTHYNFKLDFHRHSGLIIWYVWKMNNNGGYKGGVPLDKFLMTGGAFQIFFSAAHAYGLVIILTWLDSHCGFCRILCNSRVKPVYSRFTGSSIIRYLQDSVAHAFANVCIFFNWGAAWFSYPFQSTFFFLMKEPEPTAAHGSGFHGVNNE